MKEENKKLYKNMKKITMGLMVVALLFGGTAITSCGSSNNDKGSQHFEEQETDIANDEVIAFAKDFARKLASGTKDAVKDVYPGIANAPALQSLNGDSVIVVPTGAGQFDVTLINGATIKINRSPKGEIRVTDSKGLFKFSSDKVKTAKKTGMWDDNLSDLQMAERMNDEGFFKYVKNKTKAPSKIVSLGKYIEGPPTGGSSFFGDQVIVNNTNIPVDGKDYVIVYRVAGFYEDYGLPNKNGEYAGEWTETRPGKPIPANGTIKITTGGHGAFGEQIIGVKMKLSSEKIREKFGKPLTGNEYQEYLTTKK